MGLLLALSSFGILLQLHIPIVILLLSVPHTHQHENRRAAHIIRHRHPISHTNTLNLYHIPSNLKSIYSPIHITTKQNSSVRGTAIPPFTHIMHINLHHISQTMEIHFPYYHHETISHSFLSIPNLDLKSKLKQNIPNLVTSR